jgi:hypothetical protein
VYSQQDENVFRRRLAILGENIKILIIVEDPRVDQLALRFLTRAGSIGANQIIIGKGLLRIFVEISAVRVSRRRIEIEIVLLYVLTVIAFAIGEAEGAFLQDRITAVPQG